MKERFLKQSSRKLTPLLDFYEISQVAPHILCGKNSQF